MNPQSNDPADFCLTPEPVNIKSDIQPFVKWIGGKRQILPQIKNLIPQQFDSYFEPFIGGGAVLFDLEHPKAIINDINSELINLYKIIRDNPTELIQIANAHLNNAGYFYNLRGFDRHPIQYNQMPPTERAARILYLNKTCFNGLFRVNSKGQLNSAFANYKNPKIAPPNIIHAVSGYLNSADITITNTDFEPAVQSARPNDFIYFDPPYDPVSQTASFTGYHKSEFGRKEQERLFDVFKDLDSRGCKIMVSNSHTPFICELYADYQIKSITATRRVNVDATGRGAVSEVLITNY